MESIFGLFGLGCGLYCLYGYYLLKFKGEICSSILLPKDVNPKKCKDFRGYCNEAQWPLLILGVIGTLYGAVDLYNVINIKCRIEIKILHFEQKYSLIFGKNKL